MPPPGAGRGFGLKLVVTPVGWPEADNVIAASKPPVRSTVTFEVVVLPTTTYTLGGALMTVKLPVVVTVRLTVVVWVLPPPVPVTVIV